MSRRPRHHRLKSHAVYTVAEASEVLDVCRRTVRRWIRNDGLPAATDRRPWLIEGAILKGWLASRARSDRTSLQPGELYCLGCRMAQRPAGEMADFRSRTASQGMLIGICPSCNRLMHRIVRTTELNRISADLEVTPA